MFYNFTSVSVAVFILFISTQFAQAQEGASQDQTITEEEKAAYIAVKEDLGKARQMFKLKRTDDALVVLKKIARENGSILKKNKKFAFYWYKFLGIALENQKRHRKAINSYKKSHAINPKDIFSVVKLSSISLKLKDNQAAQRYLSKAMKINPKHKRVLALKRRIEAVTGEKGGKGKWEAGGSFAYGLPLTAGHTSELGGNFFFRFSPFSKLSSLRLGLDLGAYFSSKSLPSELGGVKVDYSQSLLLLPLAPELSYSYILNALRFSAGAGFGYYLGFFNREYKSAANPSQAETISESLRNLVLTARFSAGYLIASSISISVNVRYIRYFDDAAFHFLNFGLGASYIY